MTTAEDLALFRERALMFVNEVRGEHGIEALEDFEPATPACTTNCVIAKALLPAAIAVGGVDVSTIREATYVKFASVEDERAASARRWAHTLAVEKFIIAFDQRKYPDLVKEVVVG